MLKYKGFNIPETVEEISWVSSPCGESCARIIHDDGKFRIQLPFFESEKESLRGHMDDVIRHMKRSVDAVSANRLHQE